MSISSSLLLDTNPSFRCVSNRRDPHNLHRLRDGRHDGRNGDDRVRANMAKSPTHGRRTSHRGFLIRQNSIRFKN